METKIIEVSLGVGLNQLFPEPVKVVIYPEDEDNNELNNNIIKTFMDFSEERKQNLKRFYDQVIKTSNKELKLAEVPASSATVKLLVLG